MAGTDMARNKIAINKTTNRTTTHDKKSMRFFVNSLSACLIATMITGGCAPSSIADDADDAAMSVEEEQAKEKIELDDMKKEMNDIKGTINDAMTQMNRAQTQMQKAINTKEFHLVAKDNNWQIMPGVSVLAMSYNGVIPGPVLRVQEGDTVKVVLHNQLKVPTSLYFYGMPLPAAISGLPRQNAGLVKSGETFVYQFTAGQQGTYFYHPQVNHQEQGLNGLWGALIVEPPPAQKSYDKDFVFVIGEFNVNQQPQAVPTSIAAKSSLTRGRLSTKAVTAPIQPGTIQEGDSAGKITYYTVNGKS
ncbi:MAG: multicopper oxidase domain-containing protein, partial [Gammaproteobacteria bacterium]|nr:multicopper oxidase domain-containing protein [Gammaproteobacteria bacterium]